MESSKITWKGYVLLVLAFGSGSVVASLIPELGVQTVDCELFTDNRLPSTDNKMWVMDEVSKKDKKEMEEPSYEDLFDGAIVVRPTRGNLSVEELEKLPFFGEREETNEEGEDVFLRHPMFPMVKP